MNGRALEIEKLRKQMKELTVIVVQAIPTNLTEDLMKSLISQKRKVNNSVSAAIKEILPIGWDWIEFYQKYFNLRIDLSQLKILKKQEGFDRLIMVPKGFTPNQVFEVSQKCFPCEKYGVDLDKETKGRNEREPEETYAIWVRDRKEADEELKNISAETIEQKKIKTQTLLERELHELKYWDETGKHLDKDNVTLCSGSRDSDGRVPSASWCDGEFWVGWYFPRDADSLLRARAVVSF